MTTIGELLDAIPHLHYTGTAASRRRKITGFSTDSRSLTTGEIFVALIGENFDGHDFIGVAAERRAAAAVVSRNRLADRALTDSPLPLIYVDETLTAYGQIATAHRTRFKYPVIAIAGSNGKTTTKELVADVLAVRYNVLRTEGNLNNLIGVPAMMLRMRAEHSAAVIEIGTNMPGEIERLCDILRPTHGLITNIGREHLELLGSVEGVAEEEGALFRYLAAHDGTAFVNLDDPYIAAMAKKLTKRVTYGRINRAEIVGKIGKLDAFGAPMLHVADVRKEEPKAFDVQLKTPGKHTAANALAAATVGLAMKVAPTKIRRTLEAFEPRIYKAGYARLAPMRAANGARILNDTYNSNPDSVRVALETLRSIRPERGGCRIVVLGDMKELGKASRMEHEAVGRAIGETSGIDIAMFYGDEMRRAHRTLENAGSSVRSFHFASSDSLAQALEAMLAPQDIVLVKGSRGMKMEAVLPILLTQEEKG
jgi:UDP-N-acetylmuramoyl-tripeptide--D-alanyl-D-alanine ligase